MAERLYMILQMKPFSVLDIRIQEQPFVAEGKTEGNEKVNE